MPFSLITFLKTLPYPSTTSNPTSVLATYADYALDTSISTQPASKGERGIVVLSLDGEEPIYAAVEEYYTGEAYGYAYEYDAGNGNGYEDVKQSADEGLAGTARRYAAEQQLAGLIPAEARSVSFDVLFDADGLEMEERGD